MKISKIKIQNFKTFDSEGISLTAKNLTALVGENSSGKSNVLEALDIFFNFSKTKIFKNSFHHDDITKHIKIEITFDNLTDKEKNKFKIHLDENQSLIIIQKVGLKIEEGKNIADLNEADFDFEESKHGTKWEAEFEWAALNPKAPSAKNVTVWWKEDLRLGDFDFKGLFPSSEKPTPEVYQEKLEELWNNHFEKIPKEKVIHDEKVLGWKNILKGNLPKYFYIPAIKSIAEELKVLKTNPFGEMIKWLTENISEEIRKDFDEKTKKIIRRAVEN